MIKEIINNDPFSRELQFISKDIIIGSLKYSLIYERIEIDNIFVNEKYRNKKIATKLMQCLIDIEYKNKVDNITLEVRKSNSVAIHLYTKFGFDSVAIRKFYYGDEDAILMIKKVM